MRRKKEPWWKRVIGDIEYWAYRSKHYKRSVWRVIQICLLVLAFQLIHMFQGGQLPGLILVGELVTLTILLILIEKERCERRGHGPTGFQFIWAMLFWRRSMGYAKVRVENGATYQPVGRITWLKILRAAAIQFFPPNDRRYQNLEAGACTWRQYVRYMAGKDHGYGNNETEYYSALKKATTM